MDIKVNMWVKCVEGYKARLITGNYYYTEDEVDNNVRVMDDKDCSGFFRKSRFVPASYKEAHKASGFKVGDKVRIIKRATDHEKGWISSWHPLMNQYFYKEGLITHDGGFEGFIINCDGDCWHYPFFVLEKVTEKQNKMKKYCLVENEYEAKALELIAKENKKLIRDSQWFEFEVNNNLFTLNYNSYKFACYVARRDYDQLTFSEMIKLLGEYGKKQLPENIQVGDYETKWIVENDKIAYVTIGCQTIPIETVKKVNEVIKEYNKE